jgi:hypothetical protein|uniref:DUF6273 domain-containing protein n=1 Tax=Siphoviridae sp. ct6d71 TaxID=2826298 RepID=A0A8S5R2P8_9CAUD|nr:MAG TPA: hypothetical protein [Siphoviridae sp. ct6d71]
MAEYLITMREYNEASNSYDILYPNTVKENIKDLENLGGARIDVAIVGGAAGQVVNLSGAKTATAVTNTTGVAIFDNLQYGEYLVSINISGATKTQNITIDALKIYEISFSVVSATLNDNSWDIISAISASGEASNYWNVGDTKTIIINGQVGNTTFSNLSINAYILGINHNAGVEGNNRIHFCIGKVNNTTVGLIDSKYNQYPMTSSGYFSMSYEDSNTNVGGWNGCYMRSTIMSAIKNVLPTDLQNVLKTVIKYTDNTGDGNGDNSSYVTATTETICLEAEFEVHGTRKYANSYEQNKQQQYDYYKNGNSKVRYKYNDTNSAVWWWNRSPWSANSGDFCGVSTRGLADYRHSRYCNAVAPCFYV